MNRVDDFFILLIWVCIWVLSGFLSGCREQTAATPATTPTAYVAPGVNSGLDGLGKGPTPVLLGSAGEYVILAETTILTDGGSTVAGNLGIRPAVAAQDYGEPSLYNPIQFSTVPQVLGHIFAAEYAAQTPAKLTRAIVEMQAAYADAAGRKAGFTELGAGIIGGMTLAPGTYNWSTALLIPASITLKGGPNDVWIFQVGQGVIQAPAARVVLSGGARAKNIYWQVAGSVEVKSSAHMEGVILSQGEITLGRGASANSRLLTQSGVSLDANAVTQP